MKQILTDLKGEMHSNAIEQGTSIPHFQKWIDPPVRKSIINIGLTLHRRPYEPNKRDTVHSTQQQQNIHSSQAHGICSRRDHVLSHKTSHKN